MTLGRSVFSFSLGVYPPDLYVKLASIKELLSDMYLSTRCTRTLS
jgi:hypothetical protein